ncbi:MAG: molybdenum cofactor biosynthesis protein [Deltaproteobacteria bacterium]|nr:molybdenum cofactor biosynthesis protein [Deltaproteobacteria bacterium]
MKGTVVAVCTSRKKGESKDPIDRACFVRGFGIENDAHAGPTHRQVSLLEEEKILQQEKGLKPGAFGENIIVKDFGLDALSIGQRFRLGSEVILQVTQRGKECHTPCRIYYRAGRCIMPEFGIFTRVIRGGIVHPLDGVSTDDTLEGIRYAVLTVSDRSYERKRPDLSGPAITNLMDLSVAAKRVAYEIVPDEKTIIAQKLVAFADREACDLIITTGGTGLSPRDVTPEATRSIIDREIPGLAELMRAKGLIHTPSAALSRGICGLRGQTLVVNLPGSTQAVEQGLQSILPILPHAIEIASGISKDCGQNNNVQPAKPVNV